MKKGLVIFMSFLFSTCLYAQEAQEVWRKAMREYYTPSIKVIEVDNFSKERGVYDRVNGGYIDTIVEKHNKGKFVFDNSKKFILFSNEAFTSYDYLDTNITIHNFQKYIAINSTKDFEGGYMSNSMITNNLFLFQYIINPRRFKDTIPNFYNTFKENNHRVFQWIDSTKNINNITMIEKVSTYVNTETYNIDKIITERVNNTFAEVGLGAIYRDIKLTRVLNEEIHTSISNYLIGVNDNLMNDYVVVRNNFPWNVINKEERESQDKKSDSITKEWKARPEFLDKDDLNRIYTDFNDNAHTLKDLKGWILIDTWYQTCYPCFEFMKLIYDNYSELEKRGIKVLSINMVEKPSPGLRSYCENQKIRMDNVLFTEKNNKLFPIYSPAMIIISPDKKMVYKAKNVPLFIEDLLQILDETLDNYNN